MRERKNKVVRELGGEKANYGNWVSAKLVYIPGVIALLFLGFSIILPALLIGSLIFFLPFVYFACARHRFSTGGGNIQTKVQDLLLDHITGWDGAGKVLDIGCGNGPLTIEIAKRYPQAEAIGIDYWGTAWEYSKSVCDRNAEIEGVAGRVAFQSASASSLPFDDEAFGLVVSNLVFHEVRNVKDKKKLIKEALRVVTNGGSFVFQDLFLWKRVYGDIDDLLEIIRSWGIEKVEFVNTSDSGFIPKPLKLPFMLGTVGILYGRK